MGLSYYKILEINKTAKDDDIRKAYHKLAMKWHPDKNPNHKKESEAMFQQIYEAYQVLSDSKRREIYDQYCSTQEGSRNREAPRPDAGGSYRKSTFNDFFASSSSGSGNGFRNDSSHGEEDKKEDNMEGTIDCSLEEMYNGTKKKVRVLRKVLDSNGVFKQVEELLTIKISRGWKNGTKIIFPKKGNERRGSTPLDLVFVLEEKPHPIFKREGNDLVVTLKISLREALTGYTASLTMLDGRLLRIPINKVIDPKYEEVVPREGMWAAKDPLKKGNLRIRFNIKFPSLNSEQKATLKRTLPGR